MILKTNYYLKYQILFLIIISVLLFPFKVSAQNYVEAHLKVHEIMTHLIEEEKNYEEANKQFKELFTQYDYRFFIPGHRAALVNILCNMKRTWESDSIDIDFYLKQSAFSAMDKKGVLNNCKCTDSLTFNRIEQKLNIYASLAILNLDKELLHLIDSMFIEDQRVRQPNITEEEYFRVDSLNLVILKKLMDQNGRLLGIRDLGGNAMHKYEILIHHLEPEMILETWYEKIMDGIYSGDLDPQRFSNSIDYAIYKGFAIVDGKPAITYSRFGTMMSQSPDGKSICHPVKDINETNERRREIGLPPLEYYLKKNDIIYDVDAFKQIIESWGMQLIEE